MALVLLLSQSKMKSLCCVSTTINSFCALYFNVKLKLVLFIAWGYKNNKLVKTELVIGLLLRTQPALIIQSDNESHVPHVPEIECFV